MTDDAQMGVHEAIGRLLADDEFAVSWVLTIDVQGPQDRRYLAHRAGGGLDGTEGPMVWAALGMMRASLQVAEDQLRDCTREPDEEEGEE